MPVMRCLENKTCQFVSSGKKASYDGSAPTPSEARKKRLDRNSPPAVSLEDDAPGQADFPSPAAQGAAELVVQGPDGEAAEEDAQAEPDHGPHGAQDLEIARVLAQLLPRHRRAVDLLRLLVVAQRRRVLRGRAPLGLERGAQAHLHDVHAPQQDDSGQQGVHVLVEGRVLQVVVVAGDKGGEAEQEDAEQLGVEARLAVGEGGVEHQAGGVDHGELVDELHGVLEGAVEEEAPGADDEVAEEGDEEDAVMVVAQAVVDALEGEVDEQQVRERVDNLGAVDGGIVVLCEVLERLCWVCSRIAELQQQG